MRKICTLLCILFTYSVSAQPGIKGLREALVNAAGDSQKLVAYKNIIYAFESSNEDSAIFYGEQGFALFTAQKYKAGQAWMLSDLAEIDDDHGREEPAKQRSLYALQVFKDEKVIHGIAEVSSDLGMIEGKTGNFSAAITYFMSALTNFEQENNIQGIMRVYSNLGIVYERSNDPHKALYYLKLADSIGSKLPLSDAVINLYNNIGAYYADRGDTTTALKYFEQGLKKSDKPEYLSVHLSCLMNTGMIYCRLGNNGKGILYLEEALKIARSKNFPDEEANTLINLAVALSKNDKNKALSYLSDALVISKKILNKPMQAEIYGVMTDLYKSKSDYKSALETNEKRQMILDSIASVNTTKEIAGIGAIHDLEKSKLKVEELEELSSRNAAQRDIIIFIAVFVIISLVVLATFYRKTIRLNAELVKREEELKYLNGMKDKLFSVIGHDLRAPIARIPVIIEIIEDEQITAEERKMVLDDMQEHTKASVETLDKLLFWGKSLVKGVSLNMVKFYPKQYIRDTLELKKIAAADKNITLVDNVPEDVCVFADATHFDFIIRNLVVNAIKYTHNNGAIEISANRNSRTGHIVFAVKDNGVGISKDLMARIFEPLTSASGTANEKGTGIGLMLCKEFTRQNGGDIWVESKVGTGSTFYFSIKSAT